MGIAAALAAESGETTALTTQTKQMDSLVSTRGEANISGRISSDFGAFAGSTANSDALVTGLRNGTAITLTTTDAKGVTTSTTFTPPTGKMGYGNVYTSLALAKQQLAGLGNRPLREEAARRPRRQPVPVRRRDRNRAS